MPTGVHRAARARRASSASCLPPPEAHGGAIIFPVRKIAALVVLTEFEPEPGWIGDAFLEDGLAGGAIADLDPVENRGVFHTDQAGRADRVGALPYSVQDTRVIGVLLRSEEHTSDHQSRMSI